MLKILKAECLNLEKVLMDNVETEKKMSDLEKLEQKVKEGLSVRGQEWVSFAVEVLLHIENYTVPQYGDKGEDNLTDWLPGDCLKQTGKYASRHGRNSREQQDLLDILKSAHYSQVAFTKLTEDKPPVQVARRTKLRSMRELQREVGSAMQERSGSGVVLEDQLLEGVHAASIAIADRRDERNPNGVVREVAKLTVLLLRFCEWRGVSLNDMVEGEAQLTR